MKCVCCHNSNGEKEIPFFNEGEWGYWTNGFVCGWNRYPIRVIQGGEAFQKASMVSVCLGFHLGVRNVSKVWKNIELRNILSV